jgi:serine protease
MYKDQWGMSYVHSDKAWNYSCGAGVVVAVIDTGVACYDVKGATKLSDFKDTKFVAGHSFVDKNEWAIDRHGHGSHVSGTIAQSTNNGIGAVGLAHCVSIMPIKVLSDSGSGTTSDIAEGIRWSTDHGAQVINMSLGGGGVSSILRSAVKYAHDHGVTVVAAAGNDGGPVGYPAAYDGVIAVSATDPSGNIANFSSRGKQIAIGAPGTKILQQTVCNGGRDGCEKYEAFNGTSMASPFSAAAAALVVSQGITDPDKVREILQDTATEKKERNLFGAGILDASGAAAKAHWTPIFYRLAALALMGLFLFKSKKFFSPLALGSAIFASVGIACFLPLLGVHISNVYLNTILTQPFGTWDTALGLSLHKWLPLANSIPAWLLIGLFFDNKRLRPIIGGVASGSAALMAEIIFSGSVHYAVWSVFAITWLVANIAACVWIADKSLEDKQAA